MSSGRAGLDLPPEVFRALGHRLIDKLADLQAGLRDAPVARNEPVDVMVKALGETPLPDAGSPVEAALDLLVDAVATHAVHTGHPGFMGYVVGSASPVGVLADFVATALNPLVTTFKTAPAASAFERQAVRWLAELIGYPVPCDGILLSGGTMANMVALHLARDRALRRGVAPAALTVYATREVHSWLRKGAAFLGLGPQAIRWVQTGADQTMSLADLRARLDDDVGGGLVPLAVIGTCGTTSTGAVDPLRETAALCRERRIWFHVDGAYGGFAAASETASPDVRALADADSVAVDPHKWLFVPLEAGCLLVREPGSLYRAFFHEAQYYSQMPSATQPAPAFAPFRDQGPQTSRSARALKVWLTLKVAGKRAYAAIVDEHLRLAALLATLVSEAPELELGSRSLSVTTFRFVPAELIGDASAAGYLDRLNAALLTAIQDEGRFYPSQTTIQDRFLLRTCIVNVRTTEAEIRGLTEAVIAHGRRLHAELASRR